MTTGNTSDRHGEQLLDEDVVNVITDAEDSLDPEDQEPSHVHIPRPSAV